MGSIENKKLVQQIFVDSETGTGSTLLDNFAEDVRWVITGQWAWSQTFEGRDAVLNNLLGKVGNMLTRRMRTVASNFVAEGDYVVVEAKGDNLTTTGLRYDNDYCLIFKIKDGKIKEIKEYLDSALVEKVLGPFPS